MQYTKTAHVLHDTAQKTVFGHGHTRGSFLSLEPSLVEPGQGGARVRDYLSNQCMA